MTLVEINAEPTDLEDFEDFDAEDPDAEWNIEGSRSPEQLAGEEDADETDEVTDEESRNFPVIEYTMAEDVREAFVNIGDRHDEGWRDSCVLLYGIIADMAAEGVRPRLRSLRSQAAKPLGVTEGTVRQWMWVYNTVGSDILRAEEFAHVRYTSWRDIAKVFDDERKRIEALGDTSMPTVADIARRLLAPDPDGKGSQDGLLSADEIARNARKQGKKAPPDPVVSGLQTAITGLNKTRINWGERDPNDYEKLSKFQDFLEDILAEQGPPSDDSGPDNSDDSDDDSDD